MFGKIRIRRFERGLWFRHGDFRGLLAPGVHRFWSRLWSLTRDVVEIVSTLSTKLEHPLLDLMIEDDNVRDALMIVDLNDHERALVWKDDRLAYILGPGRHAFWRSPAALSVETYDINDFRLEHPRLETICAKSGGSQWLTGVEVSAHETVLLFRDGKLVDTLGEGSHVFWKGAGKATWKAVDRREQLCDVAGQEIMTNDKVTLRVNLLVTYVVTDAVKAVTAVTDFAQSLYREAQLALRAAIGTRSLDTLLSDKEVIGGELRETLAKRAAAFGLDVRGVGLKDIILPGEMKAILNQVIEAEKQAQANLIKRREETAAARSQANTAKLLAESPALARMKELELLQEILKGAKTSFVFGGSDLSEQVRSLVAKGNAE